jgi:hypothetical protein
MVVVASRYLAGRERGFRIHVRRRSRRGRALGKLEDAKVTDSGTPSSDSATRNVNSLESAHLHKK